MIHRFTPFTKRAQLVERIITQRRVHWLFDRQTDTHTHTHTHTHTSIVICQLNYWNRRVTCFIFLGECYCGLRCLLHPPISDIACLRRIACFFFSIHCTIPGIKSWCRIRYCCIKWHFISNALFSVNILIISWISQQYQSAF